MSRLSRAAPEGECPPCLQAPCFTVSITYTILVSTKVFC